MRSLPHDDRRIREESTELYRASVASRITELLDGLWDSPEFFAEVKKRFEERGAQGEFPALREALSNLPDGSRDEFLVQRWFDTVESLTPPERQPWDVLNATMESYREELYGGMAYLFTGREFPEFAEEWLSELGRVGYRGMVPFRFYNPEIVWPVHAKEQPDRSYSAVSTNLGACEDAYVVVPDGSRQVLWLQLNGLRSIKRGYREVRISDKPIRTDTAIVSALTALEGRSVNVEAVRECLEKSDLSLDESLYMQLLKAESATKLGKLANPLFLDYVLLLVRYHRPDFELLPRDEKIGLLVHTCARINDFLDALKKLTTYLEYGTPEGRAKAATRNADIDVKAAVLRDVDGLTYREIGEELGVPRPADFEIKGDFARVRQMVTRGRRFLVLAIGEEGWRAHIETMKAEAKRWNSLSDFDAEVEGWVEHGLPHEEAVRMAMRGNKRRQS